MPTYTYQCQNPDCANRFETVQTMREKALDTCPKCRAKVERIPAALPFILKGKGWFKSGGY